MNEDWSEFDAQQYVEVINGEYTFAGTLKTYFEECAKNWKKDTTREQYISDYSRIIKYLSGYNTKIMNQYELQDFEEAIMQLSKIKSNRGIPYASSVINHYRHLLYTVVKVAFAHGLCDDILWGSSLSVLPGTDEESKAMRRIQRSLTVKQEVGLYSYLMATLKENCAGEYYGCALMYWLALRDGEALALSFGDITQIGDYHMIWIYKTPDKKGNLKASGKTPNADRVLPLPESAHELVSARYEIVKRYVIENIDSIRDDLDALRQEYDDPELNLEDIDEFCSHLPIACNGYDYLRHTTVTKLSGVGCNLLKSIQYSEMQYYLASIQSDDDTEDETFGIGDKVPVKDPTAYILRRNNLTHMYICFSACYDDELTPVTMLQYYAGHAMEEGSFDRNEMVSEEFLVRIAKAAAYRPLANLKIPDEMTVHSSVLNSKSTGDSKYVVGCVENSHLSVEIDTNEPNDKTSVEISFQENEKGSVKQTSWTNPGKKFSSSFCLIKDYQAAYEKEFRRYRKTKTDRQNENDTENLDEFISTENQ